MSDTIRAAVIIRKDGKYLLVQEATPIIHGLWCWNQGKVEEGETVEEAAIREAKEETGYDVRLVRKLGVIEQPFPGTREIHVFLGEIASGELHFSTEEVLQVRWYTLEEIEKIKDQTPGPWVYKTILAI